MFVCSGYMGPLPARRPSFPRRTRPGPATWPRSVLVRPTDFDFRICHERARAKLTRHKDEGNELPRAVLGVRGRQERNAASRARESCEGACPILPRLGTRWCPRQSASVSSLGLRQLRQRQYGATHRFVCGGAAA